MSARPSVLWVTCAVPLLIVASCSTDQRDLEFGFGHGSSNSLGPPAAGSSGADAGAPPTVDGGDGPLPSGGTSAVAGGGAGGTPSAPTDGGEDAGGQPPAQAGTSQGGSAGSGSSGSGGTSDSGGSAGNGGSGGSSIDTGPCGDLDQNGVQDCEETLTQNSRFDSNAQSWLADPLTTATWSAEDARGANGSGALGLTFTSSGDGGTWSLASASQCHAAWSEDKYVVGARLMMAEGQAGGRAQLELAYFDLEDCKGTVLKSETAALTTEPGVWHALSKTVKMATGTRSVLLRLAAAKPGTQASLEVRFDDVLFRKN